MRYSPVRLAFPLVVVFSTSVAQVKTIHVWSGRIPGSSDDPTYVPETIQIEGNKPRLMRVKDPVLEMYAPSPAGKEHTAIIICPGGAYGRLAIDTEGSDVAAWLSGLGITAFVLLYRLPSDRIMESKSVGPLQDIQESIRLVRRHSREWDIDRDKVGVMGFSAGGHLASTISTHFDDRVYESTDTVSARPDFAVLVYPVITMDSSFTHKLSRDNLIGPNPDAELTKRFSNELNVSPRTPPTFIVHASDDRSVPVQNSVKYYVALQKNGVPAELHVYESGGHGFGLAKSGHSESGWPEACRVWLQARGMLAP